MSQYQKLFEPCRIGGLTLKNRYVMGPMAPFGMADAQGAVNEKGVAYYVERAKGDVGLIIMGASAVDMNVEGFVRPSVLCPNENPAAFMSTGRIMTERIHNYGAKVFFQLSGGFGRVGMPHLFSNRIACSDSENRWVPNIMHKALTTEAVEQMIASFAKAAAVCRQTGYDGVEIHAVHEGYLLDQFALALFNKRTDKFGGDLKGRLTFATEIVKAIKAACGQDFPVVLRYSLKSYMKNLRQGAVPGENFKEIGRDYEEGLEAAKILVEAGYDALDVDAGTYDSWYWNHPPMYFEDGLYLPFSERVKKEVDTVVITAGRLDDPDLALKAVEEGKTDFISLARPLLADPFIIKKIKTGQRERIRPCLSCHEACIGRIQKGSPISCAVNPASCREEVYGISPALFSKKVVVAGGGLAGMEFARVAKLRGHDVVLYEKSAALGGNIIPGGMPSFKRYDRRLLNWYKNELKLLNIPVKLNTAFTKTAEAQEKADVIAVATGSLAIKPRIPGIDGQNVYPAGDILMDNSKAGKKVAIIGGGLVGCELALELALDGREVTIIEMTPEIMGGPTNLPFPNYDMLKDLLSFNKVKILLSTKVTSILDDSVEVESGVNTNKIDADTVIYAIGYKQEATLMNELTESTSDIYQIGDSRKVNNIMSAIWDAYEVARSI
jgi:2-enoate reductase